MQLLLVILLTFTEPSFRYPVNGYRDLKMIGCPSNVIDATTLDSKLFLIKWRSYKVRAFNMTFNIAPTGLRSSISCVLTHEIDMRNFVQNAHKAPLQLSVNRQQRMLYVLCNSSQERGVATVARFDADTSQSFGSWHLNVANVAGIVDDYKLKPLTDFYMNIDATGQFMVLGTPQRFFFCRPDGSCIFCRFDISSLIRVDDHEYLLQNVSFSGNGRLLIVIHRNLRRLVGNPMSHCAIMELLADKNDITYRSWRLADNFVWRSIKRKNITFKGIDSNRCMFLTKNKKLYVSGLDRQLQLRSAEYEREKLVTQIAQCKMKKQDAATKIALSHLNVSRKTLTSKVQGLHMRPRKLIPSKFWMAKTVKSGPCNDFKLYVDEPNEFFLVINKNLFHKPGLIALSAL